MSTGNLPLTTFQQADPVAAVMSANPAAAVQSQSSDPLALPTLNPASSPYQSLDLPPAEVRHPVPALQPQQRIQDLGATTHAGAVAYLADQVLRSAMAGWSQRQQMQLAQYNKKLAASQSLYNQQAEQLYNLARSGVDPNSQQFKDARNRTLLAWQQTMQTIGERMPQEGKNGKKGKKGAEPNDALSALSQVYNGAVAAGPPVFHQVQPFLTPEYQAQARTATATEVAGAQANQAQAAAAGSKAQIQSDLYDATQRLNRTTDPAAQTALQQRIDTDTAALNPTRHLTADEQRRADYQHLLETGQLPKDSQGNPLGYEAWITYESAQGRTTGAAPKPLKYDNTTGTVSDLNTGKTYSPKDLNLPLPVAAMFKAADNQAFQKQQRALQLVAERGQAYLMGKVVQVPDPNNPNQAIYMRALDAIKQGVPSTSSIWYRMAMPTGQERARADLAVSAREQLNTMDQILEQRKDLFGPAAGRATDFTRWIGSQDPDAQRFAAAARIASDHLAGVFGGRSNAALQGIYDAIGQNKTNPAAAIAALEQMNIAAAAIQGRGAAGGGVTQPGEAPGAGTTAPPVPTHGVSLAKAMTLPINKGKTPDQVKASIQAQGYKVLP